MRRFQISTVMFFCLTVFLDVFVTKMNAPASDIAYSSLSDRSDKDSGISSTLNPAGNSDQSSPGEFSTASRVFDPDYNSNFDVFGAKLRFNESRGLCSAPWPMYGHDPQHTCRSMYRGSHVNTLKWKFDTGQPIRSSPAIGTGGVIYVHSMDGILYAIGPDGTLQWTFPTGHEGDSYDGWDPSPAIGSDGTVYVGTYWAVEKNGFHGKFFAISPDGTEKWSRGLEEGTVSSPAIDYSSGAIYISDGSKMRAFNPDGTDKWPQPFQSPIWIASSPALSCDGNVLYFGSVGNDAKVYAVYTEDGQPLPPPWPVQTRTDLPYKGVEGSPSVRCSDGTIYIGANDARLYALLPDGSQRSGSWPFVAFDGSVYGTIHSIPGISPDESAVYIGSYTTEVFAVNADTGTKRWQFDTGDNVVASPAIGADGIIYIPSCNGKLFALRPDGTLLWEYQMGFVRPPLQWASPAIAPDGTIYIGSLDGNLYAIGGIDHLQISPVSSPQVAGRPFTLTITALDSSNNVVTDFAGTVHLSDLTGTVTPSEVGPFVNGVWSGSITIATPLSQDIITVDDCGGHIANSNPFNVRAPADLLIKKCSQPDTAFAINDAYQTVPLGDQIEAETVEPNVTACYGVKVENDDIVTQAFVVKATESTETGWNVTYKVGDTDISDQILSASGYTTADLAPGGSEIITVDMTPGDAVVRGASKSATIDIFLNASDATVRDAVRAVTTVNRLPIADAGGPYSGNEGVVITFDGSSSYDPDSDALTYEWDFSYDGVTFNIDATGISPSHIYPDNKPDNEPYIVALRVKDNHGGVSSISTTEVTVNNVAPIVHAGSDIMSDEGTMVFVTADFSDPGFTNTQMGTEETFIAQIDWGDGTVESVSPSWTQGSPGTPTMGTVSASHIYADNGIYTVTVMVIDDDGGVGSDTFRVTVRNVAPDVEAGSDQTVVEGTPISLSPATFSDPGFGYVPAGTEETFTAQVDWGDGTVESVTPSFTSGSPGIPTTGTILASHTYGDNGTYIVKVTVRDDDGGEGSDTFIVTVNNVSPTIKVGSDQIADEGTVVSLEATFSDPGFTYAPAGTEESFTARVDWGDGTVESITPSVTHGSPGISTRGTISASHAYGDNRIYTVTVTVWDDDNGSSSDAFRVVVRNVAPAVEAGDDRVVEEGEIIALDSPVFTDPGFTYAPAGTEETFTAQINWGDGTVEEGILSISQGNNGVLTTGILLNTHAYGDNGIYTVMVTVRDDDGGQSLDTFTVTVSNVPPSVDVGDDQMTDEGTEINLKSPTFADPGFSYLRSGTEETFTVQIDWGDGTVEEGIISVTQGSKGILTTGTILSTHAYGDNGMYTVTVTVIDDDGGEGSDTLIVTVNNVPPQVDAGDDMTVKEGSKFCLKSPAFTDAGFTYQPASTEETFTAEIDWGDGTPVEEGVLSVTQGAQGVLTAGVISNCHVFADDGIYTVRVTVRDDDGGIGTDTFVVTVNNVAPVVDAGNDQTADEGTSISLEATFNDAGFTYQPAGTEENFTVQVDWGDGTVESVTPLVIPGSSDVSTEGTISANHTYGDNGVYTVKVTVRDDDGGEGSDTFSVTVNNVAPVVDAGNDQTADEGTAVLLEATFSDPGFTYPPAGTEETFTAQIDWGDGTVESIIPSVTPGSPGVSTTGTISTGHIYRDDGIYSVTLTVTDDDSSSGIDSFVVTVTNVAPVVNLGADLTVDESEVINFSPNVTDPGLDDALTYTWNFGDGSPPSNEVAPVHAYADNGVYTVRLTVRDSDGGEDSDTLIVTVNNLPPQVDAGDNMMVEEGNEVCLKTPAFTDAGFTYQPASTKETFTAEIDWGDGTPVEEGVLSVTQGAQGVLTAGVISNCHVFADDGVYTVRVTVRDDDGGIGTDTFVVTVNNVAPVVDAGNDQTADEGTAVLLEATFSDPGFTYPPAGTEETFTAQIDWGDGTVESIIPSVTPGSPGASTTGVVLANHTYTDSGVYTVTVAVKDNDGGIGTDSFTITASNVAPEVIIDSPQGSLEEGKRICFSATIRDPAGGFDAPYSYEWDFGDGTPVVSEVAPCHVYTDEGVYTISLMVTDKDGDTGEDQISLTISNIASMCVTDFRVKFNNRKQNSDKIRIKGMLNAQEGDFDLQGKPLIIDIGDFHKVCSPGNGFSVLKTTSAASITRYLYEDDETSILMNLFNQNTSRCTFVISIVSSLVGKVDIPGFIMVRLRNNNFDESSICSVDDRGRFKAGRGITENPRLFITKASITRSDIRSKNKFSIRGYITNDSTVWNNINWDQMQFLTLLIANPGNDSAPIDIPLPPPDSKECVRFSNSGIKGIINLRRGMFSIRGKGVDMSGIQKELGKTIAVRFELGIGNNFLHEITLTMSARSMSKGQKLSY